MTVADRLAQETLARLLVAGKMTPDELDATGHINIYSLIQDATTMIQILMSRSTKID